LYTWHKDFDNKDILDPFLKSIRHHPVSSWTSTCHHEQHHHEQQQSSTTTTILSQSYQNGNGIAFPGAIESIDMDKHDGSNRTLLQKHHPQRRVPFHDEYPVDIGTLVFEIRCCCVNITESK
jgi:hypothetical protein